MMTEATEKKTPKDQWLELLLQLDSDLSKGLVSFADEDLNKISQFLRKHKHLISEEKYSLGMKVLDACVWKLWTGENIEMLRQLLIESDQSSVLGTQV